MRQTEGERIKALYWEGNGFALLYKQLESGSFQWPRNVTEAISLTPQQYRWLMEDLSIDQPKDHKCVRRSPKSPRPAGLSSDSAQIEQWDRPD